MLVAMVITVRQALDYESTARAVGVCAVGWVIYLVVSSVLLGLLRVLPLKARPSQEGAAPDWRSPHPHCSKYGSKSV
jgi:hypothetical protein